MLLAREARFAQFVSKLRMSSQFLTPRTPWTICAGPRARQNVGDGAFEPEVRLNVRRRGGDGACCGNPTVECAVPRLGRRIATTAAADLDHSQAGIRTSLSGAVRSGTQASRAKCGMWVHLPQEGPGPCQSSDDRRRQGVRSATRRLPAKASQGAACGRVQCTSRAACLHRQGSRRRAAPGHPHRAGPVGQNAADVVLERLTQQGNQHTDHVPDAGIEICFGSIEHAKPPTMVGRRPSGRTIPKVVRQCLQAEVMMQAIQINHPTAGTAKCLLNSPLLPNILRDVIDRVWAENGWNQGESVLPAHALIVMHSTTQRREERPRRAASWAELPVTEILRNAGSKHTAGSPTREIRTQSLVRSLGAIHDLDHETGGHLIVCQYSRFHCLIMPVVLSTNKNPYSNPNEIGLVTESI